MLWASPINALQSQCEAMTFFILKAALSGVLIAVISELARCYPGFGGLIASLPLISLMAIIWLWRDTGGDIPQATGHASLSH